MLRRTWIAGALCSVLLVGMAPVAAQIGGRWERLGSRDVALAKDRDVIKVGKYEGDFGKIRLTVHRNAVFVDKMVVVYSNGGRDNIPIAALIADGGSSRAFDLRGRERHIKQIELTYRSLRGDKRKARIEVWGRN